MFPSLIFSLFCCFSILAFAQSKRPNILFVLTDDQSVGYLSYEGNKTIQTPELDRLAQEGTYFSNAHVASSAICMPSRISILLGQHERCHGVNFNSGTSVSPEAWKSSYPVLLREAGYYTGYIGKNHSPIGKGGYKSDLMPKSFDYWYAAHRHLGFYPKDRHSIFKHAKNDTQLELINEATNDFFSNEHRINGALHFLKQRPKDKPFCLSICLNLPHDSSSSTMQNREKDDPIYKDFLNEDDMPLPQNYIAKKDIVTPKLPTHVLHVKDRQSGYDYVDTPETLKKRYRRHMQAMVGIDRLIGNLRKKLTELKIAENTIIVFTSDHGLFLGQHGLGGKSLCYEITTRVPLIIYDPRIAPEKHLKETNALIQLCDIAPTLLSNADVETPKNMQGKDLTRIMNGSSKEVREYIFSENLWVNHFGNPHCEAIQDKEWKYIRYYQNTSPSSRDRIEAAKALGIDEINMLYQVRDIEIPIYIARLHAAIRGVQPVYEELYHLADDPWEKTNLINSEEHQEQLDRLKKAFIPLVKKLRGNEFPKVLRYTLESSHNIK